MERVRFEYEVRTVLRLSEAEVAQLTEACEGHYDHAVKSLSRPGPNAILNATRNTLEDGFAEVGMTNRQFDTLCKAVELMHDMRLYYRLRKLLNECADESRRLNRE